MGARVRRGRQKPYMPSRGVREPAGGRRAAIPQPREALNSTDVSVTLVHSRCSGPASTLCPSVQETSWPATLTVAEPPEVPAKATVLPRTFALAPSPVSVTEQELPEQETESELTWQPASGTRTSAPAMSPVRVRRGVDMRGSLGRGSGRSGDDDAARAGGGQAVRDARGAKNQRSATN